MKEKKQKIKFFILIIILIFLLAGCQSEEKVSQIPPKKTIGVSVASMKEDVFPLMKEAMFDIKDKDNAEVIWLNASDDAEKQKKDVESLLKENVDIIIINPVKSEEASKLAEKIIKTGLPVIALDRIVEGVKLAGYLTADSFRVGEEQAKYLAEQIDHQGKIIILKGDKENNVAYEITAGNKQILKNNSNINIVVEKWHKAWSPELAEETVRTALEKHPDIKGVLANNSNMAMAAVKVLKEKNMTDKIITVGADASKEASIAIAKGEHDADVDKMPYILGLSAFKAAIMVVRGETWYYDQRIKNGEHSVPVKMTPVMLIDKYNLIAMKYRWEELDKYIEKME